MQLFKTLEDAKGFLEGLETDLDRIDCLDYLILELEERTNASDTEELVKFTSDTSGSFESLDEWNLMLPSLKSYRGGLMKIHFEEFEERFERSFPPGRRLRFPVPSSEGELTKTVRLIGQGTPSKVHEYLVWLLGVFEKDETSGGWILREEETWRLVLDWRDEKEEQEEEQEEDWGEALWKVMNITDEFIEYLKNEEGLYFRSAMTNSVEIVEENATEGNRTPSGPRELIPWLGTRKQLEKLLTLLYQNQIISNPEVDSMVSTHFWDGKNQNRYDSPSPSDGDSLEMISWTGTQAQLKKLFYLLANDVEGRLLEWDEIRNTVICEHFFNEKKKKPFSPKNLMKLDLAHSSKENLELIHNLLEEASEA